ncbi:MAG: response regulator [Syntrophaceae bacterium]|nr:response regulator [Syntrophaceae bacterium]
MAFQKKRTTRVLVVDDEESMREILSDFLSSLGYKVVCATNGEEGLTEYREDHFDVVISDLMMSPMNGLELLNQIKIINPTAIFIMITGYPSIDTAMDAIKKGANDYIIKPFNLDEIKMKVERAILERSLKGRLKNVQGIVWCLLISIPVWLILGIVLARLLK